MVRRIRIKCFMSPMISSTIRTCGEVRLKASAKYKSLDHIKMELKATTGLSWPGAASLKYIGSKQIQSKRESRSTMFQGEDAQPCGRGSKGAPGQKVNVPARRSAVSMPYDHRSVGVVTWVVKVCLVKFYGKYFTGVFLKLYLDRCIHWLQVVQLLCGVYVELR